MTNDSCIPLSGTNAITGTGFFKSTSDSQLQIGSGTSTVTGGCFAAYGSEYSNSELAGSFRLRARTTTNYDLIGYANGSLTWGSKNVAMYEDVIPRGGGAVITGGALSRNINTSFLRIDGGSGWEQGSSIVVSGKDRTDSVGGGIGLHSSNGTQSYTMSLRPDGTATWGYKNLAMYEDTIPRSGGSVLGPVFARTVDNDELRIDGGSDWNRGGSIVLYGKEHPTVAGTVYFHPSDGTNIRNMQLNPSGTWTWNGTACQITSDQRLKQQITQIDNALLDAWEDVDLVQFKYNDAVNEKGNAARLHTGYVVQQIDTACKSHNVDISDYGLYCHEDYPEETEEVEVTQDDGTTKKETRVIREASEHYSLRYTETLVVECAYLRREVLRLKQQNENLEQRLKMLEQSVK